MIFGDIRPDVVVQEPGARWHGAREGALNIPGIGNLRVPIPAGSLLGEIYEAIGPQDRNFVTPQGVQIITRDFPTVPLPVPKGESEPLSDLVIAEAQEISGILPENEPAWSIPVYRPPDRGVMPVVMEPQVSIPAPVRTSLSATAGGLATDTNEDNEGMSIFADLGSAALDTFKTAAASKIRQEINRGFGISDPRPFTIPSVPNVPVTPWDDWLNAGIDVINNNIGDPSMSTVVDPGVSGGSAPSAQVISCQSGATPPRYLTYDTKTGMFHVKKRRRRRKALTNADMAALAFIQTLPNTQNVKTALARMIK